MLIQNKTNTSIRELVNVNQHVDPTHQLTHQSSVSKRQPTCRLNISTNMSMHYPLNVNQLVGSIHQRITNFPSLLARQFTTTNMSKPV